MQTEFSKRSALTGAVVSAKEKLADVLPDPVLSSAPPIPRAALHDELRLNPPPLSDAKIDTVQPQLIFDGAWRALVQKFGEGLCGCIIPLCCEGEWRCVCGVCVAGRH